MLVGSNKKILQNKNKPKIIFSDGKNSLLQQAIESLKNYIDPIILFKKENDIISINESFEWKIISLKMKFFSINYLCRGI